MICVEMLFMLVKVMNSCPTYFYYLTYLNTTRICVANCGSGFYGDPITRNAIQILLIAMQMIP
jgi:hypothetical protein